MVKKAEFYIYARGKIRRETRTHDPKHARQLLGQFARVATDAEIVDASYQVKTATYIGQLIDSQYNYRIGKNRTGGNRDAG